MFLIRWPCTILTYYLTSTFFIYKEDILLRISFPDNPTQVCEHTNARTHVQRDTDTRSHIHNASSVITWSAITNICGRCHDVIVRATTPSTSLFIDYHQRENRYGPGSLLAWLGAVIDAFDFHWEKTTGVAMWGGGAGNRKVRWRKTGRIWPWPQWLLLVRWWSVWLWQSQDKAGSREKEEGWREKILYSRKESWEGGKN